MTVAATSGPILAAPVLREDILVSICFSDLTLSETSFERVRALARCVDARFRFREIILVIDSANHEAYLPLVREVENLRLFALRPGSTYYDRRVIAAEESIGDVVVIANEDEVSELDISGMIAQSAAADSIVLGTRHASDSGRRALWAPVSMLGRAAGFKVNASELQTLAVPRTQLNQLLSHSDPELALRFLPRDPRLLVEFSTARGVIHPVDGPSSIGRRLQIIQKLLIYMGAKTIAFCHYRFGATDTSWRGLRPLHCRRLGRSRYASTRLADNLNNAFNDSMLHGNSGSRA